MLSLWIGFRGYVGGNIILQPSKTAGAICEVYKLFNIASADGGPLLGL